MEACVLQILVAVLRLRGAAVTEDGGAPARDGRLLARFRERIEERFRHHDPLPVYAQALGVSLSRLREACRRSANASPSALIQQRLLLEAKRALLYSDMNIAEVALKPRLRRHRLFQPLLRQTRRRLAPTVPRTPGVQAHVEPS